MKKRKTRQDKNLKAEGVYKTFPLANAADKDPVTNASIPSIDDVEQVKDWVEANKK